MVRGKQESLTSVSEVVSRVSSDMSTQPKEMSFSQEAYEVMANQLASRNHQIEEMRQVIASQDVAIRQLTKDIEHLETLHIPAAFIEFLKSIKRSVKTRVIWLVWGKKNIYQSSDQLIELDHHPKLTDALIDETLAVMCEDDGINAMRLIQGPSKARRTVYEMLRRVSHILRRLVKKMNRKKL